MDLYHHRSNILGALEAHKLIKWRSQKVSYMRYILYLTRESLRSHWQRPRFWLRLFASIFGLTYIPTRFVGDPQQQPASCCLCPDSPSHQQSLLFGTITMKNPLQRRNRSSSSPAEPPLPLLPSELDSLIRKIIFPAGNLLVRLI